MSNKEIFITGYLEKISQTFAIDIDTAFEIFSIATVIDRSFQEVYDNILIKGTKDGGVDGIHFIEQGDYYLMYVFQCKNSKGIKANQVDKFRNDFKDIFINGNKANKQNLEDLQPKIDEYTQISANGYIIEPKLFFLYNGLNNDDSRGANQQIFDTYHNIDQGFEIWDSENIYSKISNLIKAQNRRKDINFTFKPENSNISLQDNQSLYSYSIQNVRAINFRIPAVDLCELISLELTQNGTYDYLFSENIRGFLGMRARANQKMSQTLDNNTESIYFPFLNNGITIICQKLVIPTSPQAGVYNVPAINPVIVNGLQTSRVLYTKYKESKTSIQNVFVNIRLYETDDPELIDKITDATNTQTPINFRDKVSNKNFNEWTKQLFEINNIAYLTKRGETFSNKLSKDLNESVNSDTVLKFWFATFYEKPDIAKNSISKVLEEIYDGANSANPLKSLFNGSKDSPIYHQLLRAYIIYKKVQLEKQNSKNSSNFLPYSDELLSYGMYKELSDDLSIIDNEQALNKAYRKAYNTISEIVIQDIEKHKNANKSFSFPSYFKRPKCKVDYNTALGIIEEDNLLFYLTN